MSVAGLVLVCASALNAGSLEKQGKDWLDKQTDPLQSMSVAHGSSDFGGLRLDQVTGSRDVSGQGGGYNLDGVVSGKSLFMLFATNHGLWIIARL